MNIKETPAVLKTCGALICSALLIGFVVVFPALADRPSCREIGAPHQNGPIQVEDAKDIDPDELFSWIFTAHGTFRTASLQDDAKPIHDEALRSQESSALANHPLRAPPV